MQIIDVRTRARVATLIERVLIVDARAPYCQSLGERLRDVGPCQIWTAADPGGALDLAAQIDPRVVFVGHSAGLDPARFIRALRRSDLGCRRAPVILVSSIATAAAIVAARDAGAHEFLRRPFTVEDLARHLDAVAGRPRAWIEGVDYVGPDRRRFNTGDYSEALRRRVEHATSSDDARMVRALRILEGAMLAIETDPHQAERAMRAQADEIAAIAKAHADHGLWAAATTLGRELASLEGALDRTRAAALIDPLLTQLGASSPADQRRSAA